MTKHAEIMPDPAMFAPNPGTTNCNPNGIGFWALVAEDFRTHDSDLASQGFWALFWHRFGNWRMSIKPRALRIPFSILYRVMAKLVEWSAGISLPYTVQVGRRVCLEHFGSMILVAHKIGDDVIIRQNTTFGINNLDNRNDRPIIGNNVEIGTGSVILGAIHVGDNVVIGANAVVIRDIPRSCVAVGVPARIVRNKSLEIGPLPS